MLKFLVGTKYIIEYRRKFWNGVEWVGSRSQAKTFGSSGAAWREVDRIDRDNEDISVECL